jgi:hypothetical protein
MGQPLLREPGLGLDRHPAPAAGHARHGHRVAAVRALVRHGPGFGAAFHFRIKFARVLRNVKAFSMQTSKNETAG